MSNTCANHARELLREGGVIPAHPLALTNGRKLDERRQRALSRYYLDAGVRGLAIGVHTTQFEIRRISPPLLEPVLALVREEINRHVATTGRTVVRVAGVVGPTPQAVREAELARAHGFDAVLLSLAHFAGATNAELLAHCRTVADICPVIGFYMQEAVGGRRLDVAFWREFAQIENVVAIKVAPFDRYRTFDVVRGVVESGRGADIALFTGNDDNILLDLLGEYTIAHQGRMVTKRIVGGLLGHWSVWTKRAVELMEAVRCGKHAAGSGATLTLAHKITDCNAAFFDAANVFAGCIVGLHEVLRRQGLLANTLTLNPAEVLTPGQAAEIDRVYQAYPELNDDEFVAANLGRWLA
jgi:dihydrodipicolinate synthase/N-acetylneuraminate lyase